MDGVEKIVRGGMAVALALAVGGVVCVSTGWAQESEEGGRILHRYFDVDEWRQAPEPGVRGGEDGETAPGAMPRIERPEAAAGEAPGLWLSPGDDEWILGPDGPMGPSEIETPHGGLDGGGGSMALDDATDQVDDLDYQANFDPSVVPMKRGVAHNRARGGDGGTPVTYLEEGRFHAVPVGGEPRAGEDVFWGTFLMRMEPGRTMMIPSVGPEQRILQVATEPRGELTIERDEGDNFYVSGDMRGLVRINMEVAVERRYFDGQLNPTVRWEAFEAGEGLEDDYLQNEATGVLDMIGVSREEQTPLEALERLVEYHREFEMRETPQIEGIDRYVELSRLQLGVCRHRALVFAISAKTIGFETRYVYNEAHAFVEVRWPGQGWRRIDLGGAADTFNYQGGGGGSVHDGVWDEAFPRPDSYEEEMSGLSDEGADEGLESDADSEASLQDGGDEAIDQVREQASEDGVDDGEAAAEEVVQTGPTVELLEADGEVYRGGEIAIRGRVEPAEAGVSVRVVLVPVGAQGTARGIPVGEATAGADGFFEATGTIPTNISLGRWKLSGEIVE